MKRGFMKEHAELSRVNTFRVYHHPQFGYEAVKAGFSWPALLLGPIWMSAKRLWGLTVLWLLFYIGLAVTEAFTYEASDRNTQVILSLLLVSLYLALWLVPGIKGNAWRATDLRRRGYRIIKEVQAATPEDAVRVTQSPPT
jgi:hypothetical protein